jgi:DNA-directed RNA polymerase subunit M/transcription elongation factor TFIIS
MAESNSRILAKLGLNVEQSTLSIKEILSRFLQVDKAQSPQFYDDDIDSGDAGLGTSDASYYSETPCPKCKSHCVMFVDAQLRSSDEGMNRIFKCMNRLLIEHQDGRKARCGHTWKV